MTTSKVVTGASDGIGREFAIQLARAGFNVLLAARNQAKLDSVVDDICAFPLPLSISFLVSSLKMLCVVEYSQGMQWR